MSEVEAPKRQPEQGQPVLSARNIIKNYGGVRALKGVDFDIYPGTVTTLFGENGAGKSTLMKILSGVEQPTDGEIILDGTPVSFDSTVHARDCGISIIHQELSLSPNMSVRDNIFMGRELTGPAGVDYGEEARQTAALMADLEEDIAPETRVGDLRVGQQQIVEIARALSVNSRILIMDEPTSALSASEVEVLFKVVRDLLARNVAIVYISHHLEEALEITDYAVVLRDGSMTAKSSRDEIDLAWIIRHMVGENFDLGSPPTGYEFGETLLSVESLSVASTAQAGHLAVNNLSLNLRAGEIVCIYGLMGAGRTELLESLAGSEPIIEGRIVLEGVDITHLSIAERIDAGLVLVPEDRQRDGLVQTLTVGRNLSLASIGSFVKNMLLSRRAEHGLVDSAIRGVQVKTDGPNAMIGSLSGGNQQKVVIGKMVTTEPRVIVLDEPSRGIDVGAKAEVFRLLSERAAQGAAVLFSTSELNECQSIAHRVLVMSRGHIVAEFGHDVSQEQIMLASGESAA